MKIFEHNPFRVLGVISNSSLAQIHESEKRIKRFLEVGKSATLVFDITPPLNKINRTKELIFEAKNKLHSDTDKLFHSIFWDIPQEGDSEWTILKITGDDDANVLNHIIFPKKYKNKESDFKVVFNSFWKQYSKRKTYFSKFFADPNTWEK